MNSVQQFTHVFSGPRRITVSMFVNLTPGGESATIRDWQFTWSGCKAASQSNPELFAEFRLWHHAVMSAVAKQIGGELKFGLRDPSGQLEVWRYSPDAEPELEKIEEAS